MKVNFEFEDKDIKVNFENNYKLKDQTTEKGIKVLMLKGEKGDPGQAEWGKINGTLSEQIDLKNALDKKADKTDIPTKTSQLENDSGFLTQHQDLTNYAKKEDIPDVSNFITNSVNDLINYYKKNETYNRTEINQMVSAIPKFAIEVVEKLPTTKISNTTIYLLTSGAEEKNLYTEYIYVNNSWEKLGTQTVDLTNYYTKEEVNSLLSNIDLSSYYTKTEIDTKLNAKANSADVYTKTQLDDNLLPMTMLKGINIRDNETVTFEVEMNKPYIFINSHVFNREIVIITMFQSTINIDRLINTGSTNLSSFTLNGNKLTIKGARNCKGKVYKLNYQVTS
jgi:hypothetical protein